MDGKVILLLIDLLRHASDQQYRGVEYIVVWALQAEELKFNLCEESDKSFITLIPHDLLDGSCGNFAERIGFC